MPTLHARGAATLFSPDHLAVLKGAFLGKAYDNETTLTGLTTDSRQAAPGKVFIALVGTHTDGHDYVEKALTAGASVAVVEENQAERFADLAKTHVILTVPNPYLAYGLLSAWWFDSPGQTMQMVGVTGTNGKTSVTHLVERILAHQGKTVGLIGTLGNRVLDKPNEDNREQKKADAAYQSAYQSSYQSSGHTTPMAWELQETLAEMKTKGVESVVMEVSSHALEQHRVAGCDFQVGVFTNLTQDHLDYHKTMEHYFRAKAILFEQLQPGRHAVINLDDAYGERYVKLCPSHVKVLTYAIDHPKADVKAKNVSFTVEGSQFDVETPFGNAQVTLQLAGRFSIYNGLAALTAGLALGCSLESCVAALKAVPGVRGRFEVVSRNPFVIVDYAHTPDGLENVLSSAKQVVPEGARLIAVFGCGGDRDATKRPKMGHIAEQIADVLVVTSDNPRSEDPQQILADILAGIEHFDPNVMTVDADREAAIHKAIDMATPNDVIVVAGKGHEDYQILADRTIHFDDREVVQNYVNLK